MKTRCLLDNERDHDHDHEHSSPREGVSLDGVSIFENLRKNMFKVIDAMIV